MNERQSSGAAETMPRGGPDAGWLNRRMQTDALEYLDRDDVPDEIKQHVVTALDNMGERRGLHEKSAKVALDLVSDVQNPRILELGAAHGRLSEQILRLHPTATVTVTDLDPTSVANLAAGTLGGHPRATVKVADACAIDEPDNSFDLVVFALAFHHLTPDVAYRAIAEATRVGAKFLVIDIKRLPAAALLLLSAVTPLVALALRPFDSARAPMHDGYISALRAYSPEAFAALGRVADPRMTIRFPAFPGRFSGPLAVLYNR